MARASLSQIKTTGSAVPGVGTLQAMPFMVQRFYKAKGEILAWCSSEREDAHGSEIPPERTLELILEGRTKIDIFHNETAVEGVHLVEAHAAARFIVDKAKGEKRLVNGVSVLIRCDMTMECAREFFRGFETGKFMDLSLGFFPEKESFEDWSAGKTKRLIPHSIPFISAVERGSNPDANVMEIRSIENREMDADMKAWMKARAARQILGLMALTSTDSAGAADFSVLERLYAGLDEEGSLPDEDQVLLNGIEARLRPAPTMMTYAAGEEPARTAEAALGDLDKAVTAVGSPSGAETPPQEGNPPSVTARDAAQTAPVATSTEGDEIMVRVAGLETALQQLREEVGAFKATRALGEALQQQVRDLAATVQAESTRADGIMTRAIDTVAAYCDKLRAQMEDRIRRASAPQERITSPGNLAERAALDEIKNEVEKHKVETARTEAKATSVYAPTAPRTMS